MQGYETIQSVLLFLLAFGCLLLVLVISAGVINSYDEDPIEEDNHDRANR